MSTTAAISSIATSPPAPAPRAAASHALSDEVDLYAEGNAYSEADWAGPDVADLFGKDGFDFKDLIDVINPLHHLPVVGTVYRALTGDELAPAPRVIGGTLFGGIAGFVVSLANTVMESETGRDAGDTILALFSDGTPDAAAVADASPAAPIAAANAISAQTHPALTQKTAVRNPLPHAPPSVIGLSAALGSSVPNESKDPTAALIRARAAVPQSARSTAAAIQNIGQNIGPQSSIALPGGKALPIQFRSGKGPSGPANSASAHPLTPPHITPATGSGRASVTAGPRAMRTPAAENPPAPKAVASAAPAPDETQNQDREIAAKMMNALDKYQALMRSRTAPSISDET